MKIILLALVAILVILTATLVTAKNLPAITAANKASFGEMLKNYFSPVIHGWGIGYDCTSDNSITVKFHTIQAKILSKNQIVSIIKEAKEGTATDWLEVKDNIKNAIQTSGKIVAKGRIQINGTNYLLTNITKTENALTADIRTIPNYVNCKQQNVSAEDCEDQSTKVGSLGITKRVGTEIPGDPKLWSGTLIFNSFTYKFVALVYPRSST